MATCKCGHVDMGHNAADREHSERCGSAAQASSSRREEPVAWLDPDRHHPRVCTVGRKRMAADGSDIAVHYTVPLYATTATKGDVPSAHPEGWVLVPREPTEAMVDAGVKRAAWQGNPIEASQREVRRVYAAMLAAAAPPSSEHCGFSDNTCDCVDECKIDGGYLR